MYAASVQSKFDAVTSEEFIIITPDPRWSEINDVMYMNGPLATS